MVYCLLPAQALRLENRQTQCLCPFFDRRLAYAAPSPGGPVGLSHYSDQIEIRVVGQRIQAGNGKIRRAEKDDSGHYILALDGNTLRRIIIQHTGADKPANPQNRRGV